MARTASQGDRRHAHLRELELVGAVEGPSVGEGVAVHGPPLGSGDVLHDAVQGGLAEAEDADVGRPSPRFTVSRLMSAAMRPAGTVGSRANQRAPRSPCSSAVVKRNSMERRGGAAAAARAMARTPAQPDALSSAPEYTFRCPGTGGERTPR